MCPWVPRKHPTQVSPLWVAHRSPTQASQEILSQGQAEQAWAVGPSARALKRGLVSPRPWGWLVQGPRSFRAQTFVLFLPQLTQD